MIDFFRLNRLFFCDGISCPFGSNGPETKIWSSMCSVMSIFIISGGSRLISSDWNERYRINGIRLETKRMMAFNEEVFPIHGETMTYSMCIPMWCVLTDFSWLLCSKSMTTTRCSLYAHMFCKFPVFLYWESTIEYAIDTFHGYVPNSYRRMCRWEFVMTPITPWLAKKSLYHRNIYVFTHYLSISAFIGDGRIWREDYPKHKQTKTKSHKTIIPIHSVIASKTNRSPDTNMIWTCSPLRSRSSFCSNRLSSQWGP